jgi:hypothetical protein
MQINPFATEAVEYAHLRPTYPEGSSSSWPRSWLAQHRLGLRNGQRSGGDALGKTPRVGHSDRGERGDDRPSPA